MADISKIESGGVTYNVKDAEARTLIEAIEEDVDQKIDEIEEDVDQKIDAIEKILYYQGIPCYYVQGGLLANTGVESTTTARIRSSFIGADAFTYASVSNANYQITWYAYDEAKVYLGTSGTWMSSIAQSDITAVYNNVAYVRVLLKKVSGTVVSVDVDIPASGISVRLSYVNENTRRVDKLNDLIGVMNCGYCFESVSTQTGENYKATDRIRSTIISYEASKSVYVYGGYRAYLHFYKDGAYIGNSGDWLTGDISFSSYADKNATDVVIVASLDDGADMTGVDITEHAKNIVLYKPGSITKKLYQSRETAAAEYAFDYVQSGLPILYLEGDTSQMSKDNEVTLNYKYGTLAGTCTCKWQGSSSVRLGYPKRNYTIKFDNAFEAKTGWGVQKKYCMKANWIDPSSTRNVVNARLWGQVVASRGDAVTDGRATAPNYGAIDGFPIIIAINGEYVGLYTHNIPKDNWMFNMGDGASEYLVCSESNSVAASLFKGLAVCDETDYSVEYAPEGAEDSTVAASLNTLIQAAMDAGTDWETTLAPYLDIDSVVDYFIFVNCIGGHDNLGKNILYGTYDGTKWFMSAYDLDTTYGSNPYGKATAENPTALYPVINNRNQFKEAATMHRLAYLLYTYSPARLKARYKELRAGVLSDENVWYMLNNFVNAIPRGLYNLDANRWPTMPATSTANVACYMDFYRMHCAYLDKEVEALAD